MGRMNLLKANWYGRVGQTVGAKWKNLSTIRTYTVPSNPDTPAQQTTRAGFGDVSSFVALFADQLKPVSVLDTKGMSVRNAILKLNKEQIAAGALVPADLKISRGGLPSPNTATPTIASGGATSTVTWTPVAGATISAKAKVVVVAADATGKVAAVASALNTAGTVSITQPFAVGAVIHFYIYLLDFRGSSRIGSGTVYKTATVA